jgi:autotransporter adhesin
MNKSYKSVWNESTGSWVAVSELATGRSKSKRAKTAISKAILTQIAVGGMSLAGAGVAMADDTVKSGTNATVNIADGVAIGVNSEVDADAAAPTKIGGIAIGDSAYSMGSGVAVGQNSQASSDSLAFGSAAVAGNGGTAIGANAYTINNGGVAIGQSASATGSGAMALGMNASASGSGSVALGQDSVATDKNTISVGNATTQRQIANLAAGTHATDAVNLGQLAAAGLNINTSGVVTNAFVAYDTTAKTGVTLGTGTVGAQIHQLAAGTVATDAVNVGQLTAAGLNINTSGVVQNAFVAYDTTAKTGVTLGVGTAGAQIHNLVAGVADTDATNVAQLKALGATIGTSGTVTNSFVSYSTTGKDLVTLLGASGTKISNVAAGTVGATSKDAINGSQLYAAENSVATILGGSAGVNADGTIKAPTYTVGGKTYNTLDSALTAAAAATGTGGSAANSVVYDQVGQTSVTLGAAGTPVKISNVANGTTANDAVNLSQLTSATAGLATSVANSKFIGISAVMNGSQAQASGQDAVSIGGNAVASGDETLAFGTNSKATALNSIAIGYGSNANQANTVSIGSLGKERRLTNVAAGTGNTDAVNLGQVMTLLANESTGLQATLKSSPTLLGASSPALLGASGGLLGAVTPITLDQVIAVGPTNKLGSISAIGTDSVSIGLNTSSTNTNSVAIGSNINSVGVNSVAMGYGTIANGSNSMAFGSNATSVSDGGLSIGNSSAVDVDSPDGIAIGTNAESANDRAIVIGKNSGATGVQSLALGNQSMALADGSFIIGNNSTVTGTNSYVLGSNNAKVSGSNSVVLGNGSDGTQSNVISVGAKGSERKIVNVAAGTTTTDAVNLGQMTTAIASATASTGANPNAVSYDTSAHDKITLGTAGTAGTPVTIANVADGKANNDAVNVEQLKAAGLNVDTNGVVQNAFVAYDSTAKTGVTLGNGTVGAQIHKLVAGTTATDAVNLGQLTAAGLIVNSSGVAQNAFVAYDSTAKTGVTLGTGTVGAQIHQVVAGTTTTDAVNLGQLAAAGIIVNSSGVVQNAFVAYDSTAKTGVTLGTGTVGAQIHQVVAGTTTTDAVNLGQLAAAGIIVNSSGVVQNAFVAYDSTAKTGVTLGTGTVGAQIHQVVAGTTATDAVNLGQLAAAGIIVNSSGVVQNAFVAYDSTAKTGVTLGTGTVGAQIHQVVAGTTATDAVNLGQMTTAIASAVTTGGANPNAVSYDTSAHDKITLGTAGTAGTPVTIANVADGKANNDAVNVEQLKAAGLNVDTNGVVQNAFVAYDSTAKTGVTLGNGTVGAQIHQVVAGTTTTDAVNLGQLQAAGIVVNSSGVVQNAFVAYDSTAKTGVTLGTGTVGAQIHQVVAGTTGTDAVNLAQLTAAGLNVNTSGVVTNAFVAYDSTARTGVTLGNGTVGAQIHKLVAGTTATDAVNLGQLTAAGIVVNSSGVVTNAFVAYDSTAKTGVTLGTGTVGAQIHQVVAGTTTTDAVNLGQLAAAGIIVNSSGVVQNAFVAYDSTARTGVTLGVGTAGAQIHNLVAGVADTDATNVAQLKAMGATFNSSGVVQNAFVAYDSSAKTSVTLGAAGTPVKVANVADGVANNDAVNVEQLNSAISTATSANQILSSSLKYVRFGASSAATAQATGTDSMAIGGNAFANSTGGLAFGLNSRATGANSVALGTGSLASVDNTVSVGTQFAQRRIVNVADATGNNDAVNLGQVETMLAGVTATQTPVKSVQQLSATRLGSNADGSPATVFALTDVMGVGTTDKLGQVETSGTDSIAIGLNTKANADNTVSIGTNVSATANQAVAIGSAVIANGVGATAIGVNASVIADRALAIGNGSDAENTDSIAMGTNAAVGGSGTSGIAIGNGAAVSGSGTIVMGNNSSASGTNTVVIGNNIVGSKANT